MTFQAEIKKLYCEINIRNEEFLQRYTNTQYFKYHIFKIPPAEILEIDEQNQQYKDRFEEIASRYGENIEIPRGFKNRLFICKYNDDIIVRLNIESGKSSREMTYDEIKKWILNMSEIVQVGDVIDPRGEIEKLDRLHERVKAKKYRVHIPSGSSFRAMILDQDFEIFDRINIPKLSGLLLLNSKNIEIIEPVRRARKPRKDRKRAILSLSVGKYSLSIISY